MATPKQQTLAKNIASGIERFGSLKELLVSTGYSTISAEAYPGEIIAQKGVQEELEKLGFTEQAAKARVAEILLTGNDSDSLRAAQEIFKVRGTYAPEKRANLNLFAEILADIDQNDETMIRKVSEDRTIEKLETQDAD